MKRMFLLPGIAVLITLAVLFTGCPQPAEVTVNGDTTPIVKLGDPIVRVTAYEGFNVISWEPVPDADTYQVWRTDTQSSSQVRIMGTFSTYNALTAIDNVAAGTDKLADGRTYKYIVLAIPKNDRRTDSSGTPGYQAQYDLYSGKGEATVKANIPDPATYKVPQAADIKCRLDPDGTLYVSWTQPANAKAAIRYYPGGYPGDAAHLIDSFDEIPASDLTYLYAAAGAGYLYPRNAAFAIFPVIGGKATIAIQTEYHSGTFYAKDRPATLDITLDQYSLDLQWWKDTSFNPAPPPALLARYIYDTATTGKVHLVWPRILGDDDIYSNATYTNKVKYNVWKREIAVNDDGLKEVTGDWVKVEYEFVDSRDNINFNYITAVEDGVNFSLGSWEYLVYAEAAGGAKTSHSTPLKTSLTRALPAEAIISVVPYGDNGTNPNGQKYTAGIAVRGLRPGVSYKLYRSVLTPILADSRGQWLQLPPGNDIDRYQFGGYDPKPIKEWEGVLITGDDSAAVYDDTIAPRTNYAYKLVSSMGETLLGDGSVGFLVATSTHDRASVYSSLSGLDVNALSYSSGDDAKIGYIVASGVINTGYTEGVEVRLFYRRNPVSVPTTPPGGTTEETRWKLLGTFPKQLPVNGDASQSTDRTGIFLSLETQIPNAVFGGEQYQFRAIAYLNGKEMPNLSQASYTGATITSAEDRSIVSTPRIISWPTPTLNFGTTAQTLTGFSGDFLNGADINVRIVRSPTSTGRQNYWEQPGSFRIARTSGGTTYQVSIRLSVVPAAGDRDYYDVQYKYPWERWEQILATDMTRVIGTVYQ